MISALRVHRAVTVVFSLLSIFPSPPRKYVSFVDWRCLCCFEMPCQVVCYPTSFLQAIQTVEASPGALPLTTAPLQLLSSQALSCSQKCRWLSVGICRSSENVPLLCADLTHKSAATLLGSEMLWANGCHLTPWYRRPAQHCLADVAGMPTQGHLNWHSHHEKLVYLGKWHAAIGLQHHWKIAACQREG